MFHFQHILRNQSAKLPRRSPFLVHLHCSLHFNPHPSVRPSSSTHSQLPGPRIAIIGSGPSGLYVCARLLQKLPQCRIDVFDKAQAPFGLIYYGVAPDHLDMKKSMHSFERMFIDNQANHRLQLFGNVDVNRDLSYAELCNAYEAVVLAYGASKARRLGLTNENAGNCLSGKDFVSWYNGAPFFCAPPKLDQGSEAIVIGNGNVAIDCSRMLLSPFQRLAQTDITESALRALRNSRIRNVRILGRRGPKEISFTIKELRELLNLDERMHSFCEIDEEQLKADLDGMERPKRRLMELMLGYAVMDRREKLGEILAANQKSLKTLQLQFHRRPVAIETEGGNVCALRVQNTLNGHEELFPCNLLIYAVGFEHLLLDGVPRTENGQLAMTDWCRVPDQKAAVYATGWCSHAARGLIAESQQQAYSVADQIVDDWEGRRIPIKTSIAEGGETREQIAQMLQSRNVHYINWDDWRHLDKCERRMGAILGKTREKITDFTTMLRIMRQNGI